VHLAWFALGWLMYIGPWQEYKLARLIQHHQEQQSPSVPRRPTSQSRRRLVVSRQRKSSDGQLDDAASVTSSTRSGVSLQSTQSAPAQLPAPSAQSRLNDFYQHYERGARQDVPMTKAGARLPPRPRSSIGRGQPAAKRKPKAKAGPSFEDERRARILQMKRLYGLAEPEPPADTGSFQATSTDLNESTCLSRMESLASLSKGDGYSSSCRENQISPSAALVAIDKDSFTPDFDRALNQLQASMDNHEEAHRLPSPDPYSRQVDPLAMSMSADSMNGSGGLIAWSKNLRPEDLSADVTLASFL